MNDEMFASEAKKPRYWFPAKCYGWGWGLPSSWEGWITFLIFIAICCCSEWLAGGSVTMAVGIILAAACALLAVAFWKGEPPRWRWGKQAKQYSDAQND